MCLFQLTYGFSGVSAVNEYFNNFLNIHILKIRNITFPLVLFNETSTDDTGRDSDNTDSQISDADRHHASQRSDWIDVAIANGKKCGHAPPDTAESITEYIRLCIVFYAVHTKAACQHQDHNDKNRRDDLVAFFI